MRLLLDSNVVVWMLSNPRRLNDRVSGIIANGHNELFVSTASLLEITSKAATGRLVFNAPMREDLAATCEWLPVQANHALLVQALPPIHKDPFDRVIVAQAMIEEMTLITGDRRLLDYGVPVILT